MNFSHKKLSFFILLIIIIITPFLVIALQHPQDLRQHAAGIQCNNTGVTKNSDGTYSFAPLHVDSNGNVVDQNNCIIHLIGLDHGWLASGGTGGPDSATIAAWHQVIPTNLVRIAYNSYWWDTNVYVPKYGMNFQQVLQNYVKWNEQNGNYVELDTHTQFTWPPCGCDTKGFCVQYCSSEIGPAQTPEDHETYQPRALQGLTDLAKLYANDPAVIFDVWNEPVTFTPPITEQQFFQDMNDRINTVRQYAPKSLVAVFDHGIKELESGQFPLYTQQNIIIDHHNYNPNVQPTDLLPHITFEKQHGWGTIVNEYGGTNNTANEQQTYTTLAKNYNIGLSYFTAGNLITGANQAPIHLNSLGQLVQQSYTSIFGSVPQSPTQTISPSVSPTMPVSLTPTPTPTPNPNAINFFVNVCPHGLGNCGDNVNSLSGGNTNPLHTTRKVILTFADIKNNQVPGSPFQGQVHYVSSSQNFQATVSVPNLSNGQYLITIKMDGFLAKQIPGIITVTKGQQVTLSPVALVTGDINNDNQVNIQDYNALVSCYGGKITTSSCLYAPTSTSPGADILDDGPGKSDPNPSDPPVDGGDYNEFVRELSVQQGQ